MCLENLQGLFHDHVLALDFLESLVVLHDLFIVLDHLLLKRANIGGDLFKGSFVLHRLSLHSELIDLGGQKLVPLLELLLSHLVFVKVSLKVLLLCFVLGDLLLNLIFHLMLLVLLLLCGFLHRGWNFNFWLLLILLLWSSLLRDLSWRRCGLHLCVLFLKDVRVLVRGHVGCHIFVLFLFRHFFDKFFVLQLPLLRLLQNLKLLRVVLVFLLFLPFLQLVNVPFKNVLILNALLILGLLILAHDAFWSVCRLLFHHPELGYENLGLAELIDLFFLLGQ